MVQQISVGDFTYYLDVSLPNKGKRKKRVTK
jgi:hypothetical protein